MWKFSIAEIKSNFKFRSKKSLSQPLGFEVQKEVSDLYEACYNLTIIWQTKTVINAHVQRSATNFVYGLGF